MIIMLQWLHLYTLGSRGSRELKTILEIRLISSRIDQKLKNKDGKYMFLKSNLAQKSWPTGAVVGAICRSRGSGSSGLRRGFNFTVNPPQFWHLIGLDRDYRLTSMNVASDAAIGDDRGVIRPQSRDDQVTIAR